MSQRLSDMLSRKRERERPSLAIIIHIPRSVKIFAYSITFAFDDTMNSSAYSIKKIAIYID